jgi:hypothetical protein
MIKSIPLGRRFGHLTVLGYSHVSPTSHQAMWDARCDCGRHCKVAGAALRAGSRTTCGRCTFRGFVTHGQMLAGKAPSPEYRTWRAMHTRCNVAAYGYQARGIRVCARWQDFAKFLLDMGPMPKKPGRRYTIERKNNSLGYTPKNCRWATYEEQAQNKRTTRWLVYAGRKQSMAQWAAEMEINYWMLKSRLNKGWSVTRALTAPPFSTGQYAKKFRGGKR